MWMYYFEPQQRINNEQRLSKNQARPAIAKKGQEVLRRFYMPLSSILVVLLYKFVAKTVKPSQASSTKIKYLQLSKYSIKINAK